jgi:hypothetical protein
MTKIHKQLAASMPEDRGPDSLEAHLFRELKSERGVLTPEQRQVGEMLQHAGQSWRVWRPSDLLSGQIARELTEVAGLQESLFTYGKPA